MWRGGFRLGLSVSGSFVCRCLTSFAMAPFPHPAHQTGRAIFSHPAFGQGFTSYSASHVCPRTIAAMFPEAGTIPALVQMLVGEPCCSLTPYLELHAQPLTHPIAKVAVDVPSVRLTTGLLRTPRCPRNSGRRHPARRRSYNRGRGPTPGCLDDTACRTGRRTGSRASSSLWCATPSVTSQP
jgi:hypothetical protein